MEIPKDIQVHTTRTSFLWFKEGIVFSTYRPDAPLTSTDEEIIEDVRQFREMTGNKKMPVIIESNPKSLSPPKAQRDLLAREINSVVKAMAIISTSALSKMVANLFFSLKPPPYPVKMFTNVEEAITWIKKVCPAEEPSHTIK